MYNFNQRSRQHLLTRFNSFTKYLASERRDIIDTTDFIKNNHVESAIVRMN